MVLVLLGIQTILSIYQMSIPCTTVLGLTVSGCVLCILLVVKSAASVVTKALSNPWLSLCVVLGLAIGTLPSLSPTCTFILPVTPLLLPLTDLLVDEDVVVVGVASVLGPVHLPPVHLELDPGFRLLLPSCLQVTPYLQWLLIPDVIILGILFVFIGT